MAMTATQKQDAYKFFIVSFGAITGVEYMNQINDAYNAGLTTKEIVNIYSTKPQFEAIYPRFLSNEQFADKLIENVVGASATAAAKTQAKADVVAAINAGWSKGDVVFQIFTNLSNKAAGDADWGKTAAMLNNKVKVAEYYTETLLVNSLDLGALGSPLQSVTNDAASVEAAKGNGSLNNGKTFTLTSGIDNLQGTSGNDTFLADTNTSSAADQIDGGAGTDTFKTYDTGVTKLATLKNVEVLQIAGAVTDAAQDLSSYTKAVTGVEKVVFDNVAALSGKTITTTAGQSLSLATGASNLKTTAAVTWAASATDATLNLALNGYQGKDASPANLTVTGAQATTLNIASTGAANKVGTFTGPVSVTKHVITGDQSFGYALAAADAAKVTTIDASAATGGVSANTAAGTLDKSFVFTGGKGNDTLSLTAASLQALTAGSQLDGGEGKDTLALVDAAPYTLVAKDYTAINAAKGFEVLALNAGGGTVDASKLTAIKEFAVSAGTNVVAKVATGSTLDILGATSTTVSGQVGTTDLSINIGTAATATGITNTALNVTGLTNITINANKLATASVAHSVGTLTNSDNSTFTLKGNADLTIALANASTTGSKVDGSAATGKLNITGNQGGFAAGSSKGDILIGGSNDDIIKAGLNSSTLTGNAGKDAFDVSVSVAGATAATANITTITDFVKGETIAFANASGTSTFTSTKLDVSAATTLTAALDLAAATNVSANDAAVKWFQFGGDTYVVQDLSTTAALNAADVVVKLVGAQDLSTATLSTADVLTW